MPNVRLDQNGVPKAPVYEQSTTAQHRSGVTAVDGADPADASGAVDCGGYQYCRFDVTIGGSGLNSLDVQVLFWNARQSLWFAGASRSFTATGRYALGVGDVRGALAYLKVTGFSGTSFTLSADATLS
jgi:hypothetical protein